MSDQSNKLNTKLKDAAKKKVGSKALKEGGQQGAEE
jgi:hypothetical protein